MNHNRRVIAAFSTALILAGGAFLASAPAALAATCSGTNCDDTNPYTTGCAGSGASYYVAETKPLTDASTNVASDSYGYIQLWWSNTCHTNWTRMVVNVSGAASGYEDVVLDKPNSAGHYVYDNIFSGAKGTYLTHQIYALGISAGSDGDLFSNFSIVLYSARVTQPGF